MLKDVLKFVSVILAILCLAGLFGFAVYKRVHHEWEDCHTDATCQHEGCDYRVCSLCGKIEYSATYPKIEHEFGEWETINAPSTLYSGTEEIVCHFCGYRNTRTLSPLTSLPQYEVIGSATSPEESLKHYIEASYHYSDENSSGSGDIHVRYQPNNGRPHYDYNVIVDSYGADGEETEDGSAPSFGYFGVLPRFVFQNDHMDYLHIRADAAAQTWLAIAGLDGNEKLNATVRSANGMPYCGYRVLFYQNGEYSEPRMLSIPYEHFAERNGFAYVVRYTGSTLEALYGGDNAIAAFDEFLTSVESASSAWQFRNAVNAGSNFAALVDYYCFCNAFHYAGGLGSGTYWVSPDGSTWYPVPTAASESLGLVFGEEGGLCDPTRSILTDVEDRTAVIFRSLESYYRSSIRSRLDVLAAEGAPLSAEAVAAVLNAASETLGSEPITEGRDYEAMRKEIETYPVSVVCDWYAKRLSSLH